MYYFKSRVRYSEINQDKHLDLTSIINYFQDCSTFHSEDAGVGIAYLEKRNRIWIMNSWQILIYRFPRLFEEIKISTWPYDFKGIYGYRNFTIHDEAGSLCAVANSIWVNTDSQTHRPVKITPADTDAYEIEEKFPMEFASRKISLPEYTKQGPNFSVVASNIDTNHHVNNGQYIKMAENYLPADFPIAQMRAEYRRPAFLDDCITPYISLTEQYCTIILSGQDQAPYAIVEFKKGVPLC